LLAKIEVYEMKDFHNLKVWERAHSLTLALYKVTRSFPKDELYGLISQIRRASSSIPTNIAEGCGRDSQPEMIHFFQIAMGSSSELEYLIILAHDLRYFEDGAYHELSSELVEIRRMLNTYIQKLKSTLPKK
jgi:four helix bundle protein